MNTLDPKPDGNLDWHPVMVAIQNTATAEVRTYATWDNYHGGEWSDFIWVDGNFACDCNRDLFFQYAAGVSPDDAARDGGCGSGRYRICSIIDYGGRLLYYESA